MHEVVAQTFGIAKDYLDGIVLRRVLERTDLSIYANQFTVIVGPSGSGKTTLLSIIGLIIPPTEGKVSIGGKTIENLSEDEITTLRLQAIGFVFQNSTLVNALSVYDNILLPVGIQGEEIEAPYKARARHLLEKFDLIHHAHSMPSQLSGGEKQRVAIIRSLIKNPPLLLCDEPTSVLDQANAEIVLHTLQQLSTESHRGVVMITHDPRALKYADRVIEMENGRLKV